MRTAVSFWTSTPSSLPSGPNRRLRTGPPAAREHEDFLPARPGGPPESDRPVAGS